MFNALGKGRLNSQKTLKDYVQMYQTDALSIKTGAHGKTTRTDTCVYSHTAKNVIFILISETTAPKIILKYIFVIFI